MRLLIVILLFITSTLFAQPKSDKVLHFVAGAAIADVTFMAVYYNTDNEKLATFTAIGASVLAGLTKELIDQKKYSGFDSKDLAATALGGVAITVSFKIVLNGKKEKQARKDRLRKR